MSYMISVDVIGSFPGGAVVKNLPANAGNARDLGSIPGLERSLEVGNGNPLQYSCLEISMDRGAWWATVHGVAKSQTRLNTAQDITETRELERAWCVAGEQGEEVRREASGEGTGGKKMGEG